MQRNAMRSARACALHSLFTNTYLSLWLLYTSELHCRAHNYAMANVATTCRQMMRGGRRWTRWNGCSSTLRTSSAFPRCARSTPRSSRRGVTPNYAAQVLRLSCVACLLCVVHSVGLGMQGQVWT